MTMFSRCSLQLYISNSVNPKLVNTSRIKRRNSLFGHILNILNAEFSNKISSLWNKFHIIVTVAPNHFAVIQLMIIVITDLPNCNHQVLSITGCVPIQKRTTLKNKTRGKYPFTISEKNSGQPPNSSIFVGPSPTKTQWPSNITQNNTLHTWATSKVCIVATNKSDLYCLNTCIIRPINSLNLAIICCVERLFFCWEINGFETGFQNIFPYTVPDSSVMCPWYHESYAQPLHPSLSEIQR